MGLLKNILFYSLVLLGLVAGVWAYFHLKALKRPKESALSHIPAFCALYMQSNDLNELNNRLNARSLILDRFSDSEPLSQFLPALEQLLSMVSEQKALQEQFFENRLHFAYYPNAQAWLCCLNLKELGDERAFLEAFASINGVEKINPGLYACKLNTQQSFFRLEQGSLCISDSESLLEKAFDPATAKMFQDTALTKPLQELDNNPLLGMYIDHQLWKPKESGLAPDLLGDKGRDLLQVNIEPSALTLNGIHLPGSSALLKALMEQRPAQAISLDAIPPSASCFTVYSGHDFKQFRQTLEIGKTSKTFWESCKDSALYNIEEAFYQNLEPSLAEFGTGSPDKRYFTTLSKDSVKTEEQLRAMSDSVLLYENHAIYKLRESENSLKLFSPLSELNCAYALLTEERLYFSASLKATEDLVQLLRTGEAERGSLKDYLQDQFPEESNLLIYLSPEAEPERAALFFPLAAKTEAQRFSGLKHASVSLLSAENSFQYRARIQYENPQNEAGESLLWSYDLDTLCKKAAFAFVNHQSGERELIVQDEANTLYLFSGKGKLLWKRRLDEAILSPVFRVDAFRNNKFQMLFSSASKIWLIDRLGRDVEGFPVKAPAPISSPLQVYDYENNREYRLLFACVNQRIYNYTIEGRANAKFLSVKTNAGVDQPVQYVKIGESDYLLALDREGQIYAFSRKGELRLRLKNRCLVPPPECYVDAGKNLQQSKISYVDEKGSALHRISFSDKKEIMPLQMPDGIQATCFSLIDDNRNMDLLLFGNNSLKALNLNGSLLFETEIQANIRQLGHYSDENHALFYGLDSELDELWLYEQSNGSKTKLKAAALPLVIDLFRNNQLYLVYPEGARLNCRAY